MSIISTLSFMYVLSISGQTNNYFFALLLFCGFVCAFHVDAGNEDDHNRGFL